eukprot:5522560-Pleurochrysis_carterae.AAC.1
MQRHDGGLGVDVRWVIGKDGHRAFVGAQRGESMYPVTVNACEQQAATGRDELDTEGVGHRAVERVGTSRR